ncbi:MAG: protein kinase [Bacteroidota bacterium]
MGASPPGELLFGKFEVFETLKKDDHAGVYVAHHAFLGKRIVLKVLDTRALPDEAVLGRFRSEARILARLDHPRIIRVLDFGVEAHRAYISFEYFEGRSLRALLLEGGLSSRDARRILVQILEGLAYAHAMGVVHRDIKPENILVSGGLDVRIGDFGLALAATESRNTSPQSVLGTPCQMAPEQILGGELGPWTDLFSLGIIAYEMFLGVHPFVGKDVNQSLNNILNFDEESLFGNLGGLSPGLQSAIRGLLRKDPADRWPDAGAVLQVLGEGRVEPVPLRVRRRWLPYAAAGVGVLATGVALFLLFPGREEERGGAATAPSPDGDTLPRDAPAEAIRVPPEPAERIPLPDPAPVSARVAPPQAPARAGTGYGSLRVECMPWADVILDSVRVETTPLARDIALAAGEHELRLVHPGYPLYRRSVVIEPGGLTVIGVNLDTLFGYLSCEVHPWAEVVVDGESRGETPLAPLRLHPGEHLLELRSARFGRLARSITIARSDTLRVRHRFGDL